MAPKGTSRASLLGMYTESRSRQALGTGHSRKPLPRLPRGWSRVCHEAGLFLRTIGLGIVVTAFQGFLTKNFSEPEKIAIRQNRVTALLRALIHALPLGLAIFEIVLNWKSHYVGAFFVKQNYFQFVAKTHEILMQASIATVVLSYIRYQISSSKGMPFGAVLGALQFLQISYLWSMEFWSAIMSKEFTLKKKIRFAGLLLVSVTVAATAGPSSANLLIPRQQTWPKKSSYLAVNATFQDIWPSQLEDTDIPSSCSILKISDSELEHECPLFNAYDKIFLTNQFVAAMEVSKAVRPDDTVVTFLMPMTTNGMAGKLVISSCSYSDQQLCATLPQYNLLDGIAKDNQDDIMPTHSKDRELGFYKRIKNNYYQPYTAVSCVTDTIQNRFDQAPLRFSRIAERSSGKDREILSVPGLTRDQFTDNISGNDSGFHVAWADLPQNIFKTEVPGMVILHPQSSRNISYNITTCTVNAGWGSSVLKNDFLARFEAISSMTKYPPWPIPAFQEDAFGLMTMDSPVFVNESDYSYPQLPISISKSWMKMINPPVVLTDNSTTHFIPMLLSHLSSHFQLSESDIAMFLDILFASALSANGQEHNSKGSHRHRLKMLDCFYC